MPQAPKAPKPNVHVGRPSGIMDNVQMTQANEMERKFFEYADSLPPDTLPKDRKRLLKNKLTQFASELLETPLFKANIKEGDPECNWARWMEVRPSCVKNVSAV